MRWGNISLTFADVQWGPSMIGKTVNTLKVFSKFAEPKTFRHNLGQKKSAAQVKIRLIENG